MARLLFGVTGGIAAYKALEAVRLATKEGHSTRVIQTPTSEKFVGRASFAAITGAPVLTSEFEPDPNRGAYPGEPLPDRQPISHLALVERAELYLIAPASANTIAKLAHGHADNLITTGALAATCPLVIAPAMNNWMYLHPATQQNVKILAQRGATIIEPGEGELASHGEHGVGRLAEPQDIINTIDALLSQPTLKGLNVLVTAGGTREPIDSVRFIGNRSSGRMGFALAQEAAKRGATVTLIAANASLPTPHHTTRIDVQTAADLQAATEAEFEHADILLMSAAVADFRPAQTRDAKIKKDEGVPTIELEPTEDILKGLAGRRAPHQTLIGFAAEHGTDTAVEYGKQKLTRKRLDAVVVNDIAQPGIGFDAADNEVTIVTADGRDRHVARQRKDLIAQAVLDEVERIRREGVGAGATAGTPGVREA